MRNTPIKEIIVATPAMVVIGSRFKPRWVNLLFRFLVIGKVNLSLLLFPSINPATYLLSVLSLSLYAKGMSVADIESEMQEIYGINLSLRYLHYYQ